VTERYQRIATMTSNYDTTVLCEAFGVSRSGYYAWQARPPSAREQSNERLVSEMHVIRQGEEVCYGSPRLTKELQARGLACSENRVARLMRTHGLRAQQAPRFVPRTTDSDHDEPIAPNRLAEAAAPDGPNQIWLQDITYVRTGAGWLYLALVLDLWSRKIVGWAMADHLRAELVIDALRMAQTQRQPGRGLLVHSDRGVQYACAQTRAFLEQHGWIASMSRTANPYDNAWMESAIGKIKNEVLGGTLPVAHAAARQQLFVGIESWYNQRRRHSALGYQSPVAFETQFMNN
jgi:transposase InsO family protein